MTHKQYLKVLAQGYDAGIEGLPSCHNPYDTNDPRHNIWFDGWETAELEVLSYV